MQALEREREKQVICGYCALGKLYPPSPHPLQRVRQQQLNICTSESRQITLPVDLVS